jgi:cyanophycinase-like exopeptidase
MSLEPGKVILLGSGETAPSARKVYNQLFSQLAPSPKVCVMETPAGFEPNSDKVAARVADFLEHRLQNYRPRVSVVPARKRGTQCSPDNADIIAPLLHADVMFLGPGSPTYAVRQLQDTLAWHTMVARHRLGASLILASASTLSFSAHTIPVYEIYKVGEDLHWHLGLDFFGLYGLSLVLVPHWNNAEGGADLDTSRCYMGQNRFNGLMALLPPRQTVVGIDEHTALVLNFSDKTCLVQGKSSVTLVTEQGTQKFESGEQFPMEALGPFIMPEPDSIIPPDIWQRVQQIHHQQADADKTAAPPPRVMALMEARLQARANKEWAAADQLRDEITSAGWLVKDTPNGPVLEPIL